MIRAYVLIQSVKQTAKQTVNDVLKIPGVVQADALWGINDAIAVVEADDLDHLDEIICHKMKDTKICPTIGTTATMIAKNLSIPDKSE